MAKEAKLMETRIVAFRISAYIVPVALILLAGVASTVDAFQVPSEPSRNPANGHFYRSVRTPQGVTWQEASQAAQLMVHEGVHGHLVTITSKAENEFVQVTCPNPPVTQFWIGGLRTSDGQLPAVGWKWVTDEPWEFTNWEPGNPNNLGGKEDRLGYLNDGTWNDAPRDEKLPGYIVEFEPARGVKAVTITPYPVVGGQNASGVVTLPNPAPAGGAVVRLSTDVRTADLPSSITIAAGQMEAPFAITTVPINRRETGKIHALYAGVDLSADLIIRPPGVALLELIPVPVIGGQTILGQLTLEAPAGSAPIAVDLSTGRKGGGVSLPQRIQVPAGITSVTFKLKTSPVTNPIFSRVTATANGTSAERRILILPRRRM